jgi:hypothetical protein
MDRTNDNDQDIIRKSTTEDALQAIYDAWSKNLGHAHYDKEREEVGVRVNRYVSFRAYVEHKPYKTTIVIKQF